MIDIHNHILFGIDDGCKTINDSIQTLIEASNNGINAIILTPHYIKGSKFVCNNKNKNVLLNQLKEAVDRENINIDLYLGNEVYIENNMVDLIKQDEIMTLNNSKYLLFELPMGSEINNLSDIIFNLRVKGYIPIIAHPERYIQFQESPDLLLPLIEQGCLFQANLCSLIGIYGKEAQSCLKTMLKCNYIHFIASDVHHPGSRNYIYFKKAYKVLYKLVGKDYANELVEINPRKVINNVNFEVREPKDKKRKLFFF